MLLRITDGTTTVVLDYDAGSPATGLAGAIYIPTEGDGATVTETIEVVFSGVSDSIIDAMSTVRRLLSQAAEAQINPGVTRVYLEYAILSSLALWRSELTGGRLVWSTDRLQRQLQNSTAVGQLGVIITRVDYWEGPQEDLVESYSILNGTTSPYNAVPLTAPTGDLPTPVYVEMVNQNPDNDARRFLLTMDSFAGLTTNQHLLTSGAGAKSWGGAVTHSNLMWTLTIPNAVVAKLTGFDINVAAAFSALPENIYVRATLYSLVDGSLYIPLSNGGEKYSADKKLLNLGTLQVPKLINGNLVVVVSVYAPAGSATMAFTQITPARGGIKITASGEWTSNDAIIYDGANDGAWYDTGTGRYPMASSEGGPLMAWPGRTNRLFILYDEAGSFTPSRNLAVSVYARPRRRTL